MDSELCCWSVQQLHAPFGWATRQATGLTVCICLFHAARSAEDNQTLASFRRTISIAGVLLGRLVRSHRRLHEKRKRGAMRTLNWQNANGIWRPSRRTLTWITLYCLRIRCSSACSTSSSSSRGRLCMEHQQTCRAVLADLPRGGELTLQQKDTRMTGT